MSQGGEAVIGEVGPDTTLQRWQLHAGLVIWRHGTAGGGYVAADLPCPDGQKVKVPARAMESPHVVVCRKCQIGFRAEPVLDSDYETFSVKFTVAGEWFLLSGKNG